MNVYNAGFISVAATGAVITTSGVSARVAIPNDASGNLPRFIRIAASQAACIKLGGNAVTATTSDLQVQPGDAVILSTGNQTYVAAIQVAAAGAVQISPLESI